MTPGDWRELSTFNLRCLSLSLVVSRQIMSLVDTCADDKRRQSSDLDVDWAVLKKAVKRRLATSPSCPLLSPFPPLSFFASTFCALVAERSTR
jgi:hypothetical protein